MHLWTDGPSGLADWLRQETVFEGEIAAGRRGLSARRVQEWLTLHGHALSIDSDYGAITTEMVAAFQEARSMPSTGRVDEATFTRLTAPARAALQRRAAAPTLNAAVLDYARGHHEQRPREVGGQNRGPWVRMYTDGHDGTEWAWCAGFVTLILRQACETLNVPMPIRGSVSCDTLAAQAKAAGLFVSEAEARRRPVPPGSLFLVRRTDSDWTHTGIVERSDPLLFRTIEGNSNGAGEREGYEVCNIARSFTGKDFILLTRDS